MKKSLAMLLALVMLFALCACGQTAAPAASAPAASAPAAEAPAAEAPAAEAPAEEADPYADLEEIELIGADSTGKGAAGQIFGEMVAANVAEITGGKFTIDYHPNGDLGGDADLLRQAQSGDIAIVVCQTAPTVSFIPEMAVFDLPMVFAKYDGAVIDEVLNGENEFNTALCEAYEAVGFHYLGIMQNATYRLTTSNSELKTLEDFAGLQIRTMENKNHMAFWSAIGAEPTPLAWAEVFQALQTGMLDAQENAADTCVGANFQDVQKYLACTNHILYANQILINADVFNSLPEAYQAALVQAVKEALAVMNPQLAQIDADNKKILEDGGMTIIEYPAEFYDEILALDGVKALYESIDKEQVNGLGSKLVAALEAAA